MPPPADTRGEEEGAARLTPYQSLALGLVTVAVVLLAAAYYWYNFTGWAPFSYQGATPYAPGGPGNPQNVACAAGAACLGGACRTPCTGSKTCASGSCVSDYCTLSPCSDSQPCATGLTCESGLCKQPCCRDGWLARGGSCLRACADSGDCGAGAACYAGACMAGAEAEPVWKAPRGAGTLRFKKAVFAVTDPRGVTHRQDVTAVLNGMAVAYRGAPAGAAAPTALRLDRPLNAFSFTIPGVNDARAVAAGDLPAWKASATSLTGSYREV